ncbi:MAG: cysteine desulfurase family protein [Candidatus Omnitrophota bacterium]|nr:cysteine desulfurase family protein [Candidatus Omnitrophota bacterium]
MKAIYLDCNATQPVRPEVRRAVQPFLDDAFGNPSSLHSHGRRVRETVEEVRGRLLRALGDPKGRLIFTSGGTEADNLGVAGAARALRNKGDHLILSAVEHHAVLHAAEALAREGFRLSVLPVDSRGTVDLQALERAITPQTLLISVMHANNEVGTIQPIEEVGRIAREKGVLFHTDAVQSFSKLELNASRMPVDLISISGHKLGGLKGTGALYVRQGVRLEPLLRGGPHEQGLRAGTEGGAGIAAMGAAAEAALAERDVGGMERMKALRDRLEQGLREKLPGIELNGHPERRLPGTLNLSFSGCQGETLLMALDLAGVSVSTGSACASGSTEPSHVLEAMGLARERIAGSIRFSLGWATTAEEIEEALRRIPPVIERVRLAKKAA